MALEKVNHILRMADEANTAAIAYICTDYNMVSSVVKIAEETNTPSICMLLPEHVTQNHTSGIGGFGRMVRELAESVSVPIGLHLDHSYEYGFVMEAIKRGFRSVMFDASALPLSENIALTRKVTETAHIFDTCVEAELGHVGLAQDGAGEQSELYTDAGTAEYYCRETGVDALTIAIGSAHGEYKQTPKLDIGRLEEINAATQVPLVLHGGSGIPHDQLEVAFRKGINKFNVGTEFLGVYYDAVASYVENTKGDGRPLKMLEIPGYVQERLQQYLREKMKLSKF